VSRGLIHIRRRMCVCVCVRVCSKGILIYSTMRIVCRCFHHQKNIGSCVISCYYRVDRRYKNEKKNRALYATSHLKKYFFLFTFPMNVHTLTRTHNSKSPEKRRMTSNRDLILSLGLRRIVYTMCAYI